MPRKTIAEIAKAKGMTPAQMGAKGGAATKGISKFKITPGRKCVASACPIFPCWAAPSSKDAAMGGKCALAKLGGSTQNFTTDVLLNGEVGFDNQMQQLLSKIAFLANNKNNANSFGVQTKLLKEVRDTKVALYGQKLAEDPGKLEQLEKTNLFIAQIMGGKADKSEQELDDKYDGDKANK
jgi:hypothetical protein